jgi:hypothetical protein
MAAAAELSPRDRQRLRRLDPLRDEGHPAWRALDGGRAMSGLAALEFLGG